ncbi:MAG: tetratricopeptide repeat protein [Candidatus Latescibacterota bacterium]|nr:MAG: tetratricopeptide repeat protein [Candidatus Latescibacterota bacterium]
MTSREKQIWIALLVLAIFLRVAVHSQLAHYVLYRVPLVDAEEYVGWAAMLAQGGAEPADVYYKAPLYPRILAFAMRLFGPTPGTATLLNAALGVLNVLLFGVWVRRFAGARIAMWTSACAAVYGPFLYFEAQALPTTLGVTWVLGSLLALSVRQGEPRSRHLLLAGLCMGLAVVTRPSFLLWVPLASVWVGLGQGRAARRWGAMLLVAAAAMLAILPVTLRNRAQGGEWVLVSANGGINFYLGNNAAAERTSILRPGLEWENLVRNVPPQERRGQARWDRHFARRAWTWVREEPAAFVAGLGRKTLHYFDSHEIDRNLDVRGFRAQSSVLRWAPRYACLAPWLFLGVVVAWRRGRVARLALLFWASVFAATVLIFVTERYKVDATAATLPLTLLGVRESVAHLRRRTTTVSAWLAALLIAAGAVLAYANLTRIRGLHPAHAAILEGVALYKEGQFAEAITRLQSGLARHPQDADGHYQLATALQKQNRLSEALRAYEAAAALVPGNPKPHMGVGWILKEQGRLEAALERYERALHVDPHNALVAFETATLLERLGRSEEARRLYARVVGLSQDPGLGAEAARREQRLRDR